MIRFAIGEDAYLAPEPATWIDSATGQPIGDGMRGSCYWRLDVIKEVEPAIMAAAKAMCLADLGDERVHGESRCCQAGGGDGCCLDDYVPVAEKAIAAYHQHTQENPMPHTIKTIAISTDADREAAAAEISRLAGAPGNSPDAALARDLQTAIAQYDEVKARVAAEIASSAPFVAPRDPIMQFFAYNHLPAHLQEISQPFGLLAEWIVTNLPRNPERTVALRKLLEAKDAGIRAKVAKEA